MRNVDTSIVATIATIALLCGCSQTYAGKDGSTVTISGDGTKIAMKSSDGSGTVSGTMDQEYPATFPVPQYPGSKITTNMTVMEEASNSAVVPGHKIIMLSTSDKSTQIVQFYKDKLSAAGWKIENSMDAPGAASFVGAVKDKLHLNISIVGGPSDTAISISLQ